MRRLKTETLPEGFLLTTDYQTSGRGYAGNRWESEPSQNIMMSLLLKPTFLPVRKQFYLNQVLSLAVHDAFAGELKKTRFKIKWPNDLVYDGRKICGMLVETQVLGDVIQNAMCGIGFNLNQNFFEPDLNATSLALETRKTHVPTKAIAALCSSIEARYLQLKNNKVESIQKDYMERLYRLESYTDYRVFGKELQAKIVGLNPEGKLVLESEDGFKVCGFKEVEFLN